MNTFRQIFRNRDTHAFDLESAPDLAPTILALETAYSAPIPTMRFNPAAAGVIPDIAPRRAQRRWKPALAIVAIALIAIAAIAVPLTRDGHPQTVSAKELLTRARNSAIPYHKVYISTIGSIDASGPVVEQQRGEVWYRDPEHIRYESREGGSESGHLIMTSIRDGDEVWQFFDDGGTDGGEPITRVIHGSMRSALGHLFAPELWQSPGDLGSALAVVACDAPSNVGKDSVAGRPAHVINACGVRLWVDAEVYQILKVQYPPAPDLPVSTVNRRYYAPISDEVVQLDISGTLNDSLFTYTPPPGTVISEQQDLP